MAVQFSLVVGLAVAVAVGAAIYVYLTVKKSIPLKYVRRCEQRERFRSFVNTALSPELQPAHLDLFWDSTADCHALFNSYPVFRLRRELMDHAKILIDIPHSDEWSKSDTHVDWADVKSEALAWFADIADHIDGVFEPETTRDNALPQVIDETFRLTGRSLRT